MKISFDRKFDEKREEVIGFFFFFFFWKRKRKIEIIIILLLLFFNSHHYTSTPFPSLFIIFFTSPNPSPSPHLCEPSTNVDLFVIIFTSGHHSPPHSHRWRTKLHSFFVCLVSTSQVVRSTNLSVFA